MSPKPKPEYEDSYYTARVKVWSSYVEYKIGFSTQTIPFRNIASVEIPPNPFGHKVVVRTNDGKTIDMNCHDQDQLQHAILEGMNR